MTHLWYFSFIHVTERTNKKKKKLYFLSVLSNNNNNICTLMANTKKNILYKFYEIENFNKIKDNFYQINNELNLFCG